MSDDVTAWLRRIDGAVMETFGFGGRADAKRKIGSRRRDYERVLREVRDVAGPAAGRKHSDWIESEIRTAHLLPPPAVHERGNEVSTANWLGA